MTVIIHTKTNHHYIIDDVCTIDIQSPALDGAPIPEEEGTKGFRFIDPEDKPIYEQDYISIEAAAAKDQRAYNDGYNIGYKQGYAMGHIYGYSDAESNFFKKREENDT